MSHLKRQKIPKNWPIPRKGTKYIVRPRFAVKQGIPLLILLRDILKIAQNRKEVKIAIHNKNILVNGNPAKDERAGIQLFDKITIVPSNTCYQLILNTHGKFDVEEVKEKLNEKIAKIINKKILKGKKVQLNLSDGRNYLSDLKCKVNDSVIVDFKKKKILKCLPLKENSKAIIISGKHSGKKGVIKGINNELKMAEIETDDKKINVLIKQIMVVE